MDDDCELRIRYHGWVKPVWGWYRLIRGALYRDAIGSRVRILSFCIDDRDQGPVVELPIFPVGAP